MTTQNTQLIYIAAQSEKMYILDSGGGNQKGTVLNGATLSSFQSKSYFGPGISQI